MQYESMATDGGGSDGFLLAPPHRPEHKRDLRPYHPPKQATPEALENRNSVLAGFMLLCKCLHHSQQSSATCLRRERASIPNPTTHTVLQPVIDFQTRASGKCDPQPEGESGGLRNDEGDGLVNGDVKASVRKVGTKRQTSEIRENWKTEGHEFQV